MTEPRRVATQVAEAYERFFLACPELLSSLFAAETVEDLRTMLRAAPLNLTDAGVHYVLSMPLYNLAHENRERLLDDARMRAAEVEGEDD